MVNNYELTTLVSEQKAVSRQAAEPKGQEPVRSRLPKINRIEAMGSRHDLAHRLGHQLLERSLQQSFLHRAGLSRHSGTHGEVN